MPSKDPNGKQLREHLLYLLDGGGAHARFDDVVKNMPEQLRSVKPAGLQHSAWMLLEHLRLAQLDILEFSRNSKYKTPEWPKDYWPKTEAPPSAAAWSKSIQQFRKDLKALCSSLLKLLLGVVVAEKVIWADTTDLPRSLHSLATNKTKWSDLSLNIPFMT